MKSQLGELLMGNEIEMINDDLNNFLTAFDEGNEKALMEMSGQADGDSKPKMGLPRLTINYERWRVPRYPRW
jgi:hypothetical protein